MAADEPSDHSLRYIHRDSVLHRLYPLVKLVWVFLVALGLFLFRTPAVRRGDAGGRAGAGSVCRAYPAAGNSWQLDPDLWPGDSADDLPLLR